MKKANDKSWMNPFGSCQYKTAYDAYKFFLDEKWDVEPERFEEVTSEMIDTLLACIRSNAGDLWGAANTIPQIVISNWHDCVTFAEEKYELMDEICDDCEGVCDGSNLNKRTGFFCAMLTKAYGVKENSFANFDT